MSRERTSLRAKGRKSERAPRHQRLSRDEIVGVALRLIDRHGLEALSLRKLASELGVTPAAVSWHVRSKDELLDALVRGALMDLDLPPCANGSWADRVRELHGWFRTKLLESRKLVFTPAFRKVLPYAFMEVGIAGKNILREAGLQGADLVNASRALYWHTMAFVFQEASASHAPPPTTTPKLVLDGAIDALRPEDFSSFVETLPQALDVDRDALFRHSLDCLLRGLEKELERARRPRRTSPARDHS
jgi:TetR/AcrR family tetracycline transcriptional repressor